MDSKYSFENKVQFQNKIYIIETRLAYSLVNTICFKKKVPQFNTYNTHVSQEQDKQYFPLKTDYIMNTNNFLGTKKNK